VHAVSREKNQHNEIGNEQFQIEGVNVVDAAERFVQKMLLDIATNALGAGKRGGQNIQDERSGQWANPVELPSYRIRCFHITAGARSRPIPSVKTPTASDAMPR